MSGALRIIIIYTSAWFLDREINLAIYYRKLYNINFVIVRILFSKEAIDVSMYIWVVNGKNYTK